MTTKVDINFESGGLYYLVHDAVANTVAEAAIDIEAKIQKSLRKTNNQSGMNPSAKGEPPAMGIGGLAISWGVDLSLVSAPTPIAVVSSNLRYAAILEYGSQKFGRIKPKSKKFLTIPLNAQAVIMRRNNKDLRSVSGLFIIPEKGERITRGKNKGKRKKGRKGKDYLVLAKKDGDKITPMFLLVKSVYISKRPYIRPNVIDVKKDFKKKLNENIAKAISGGIGRGTGGLLSGIGLTFKRGSG